MDWPPSDPRSDRIAGQRAAKVLAGIASAALLLLVIGLALGGYAASGGETPHAVWEALVSARSPHEVAGGLMVVFSVFLTLAAPPTALVILAGVYLGRDRPIVWFSAGTLAVVTLGTYLAG